jgi:hypothetical protein
VSIHLLSLSCCFRQNKHGRRTYLPSLPIEKKLSLSNECRCRLKPRRTHLSKVLSAILVIGLRRWVGSPTVLVPSAFLSDMYLEPEVMRVSSDDGEHLTCVHEQMVSHKLLVKPINLDDIIIVLIIIHHLVVPEFLLFQHGSINNLLLLLCLDFLLFRLVLLLLDSLCR